MNESTLNDERITVIAKVGKAYGLKGLNTLWSYAESPKRFLEKHRWLIETPNQGWQAVTLTQIEQHADRLRARINDNDAPEAASQDTGKKLGILKSELPALPKGEYYQHELIGLSVMDLNSTSLGTITDIWSNGAHDVFEVQLAGRKRVLPYIKDVIQTIDKKNKTMIVDWPYDF